MKSLKARARSARGRRAKFKKDNRSAASAASCLLAIKQGDTVLYLDKSGAIKQVLVDQVNFVNHPPTYLIKFANNTYRETERSKLLVPAPNQFFTNGSDDDHSEHVSADAYPGSRLLSLANFVGMVFILCLLGWGSFALCSNSGCLNPTAQAENSFADLGAWVSALSGLCLVPIAVLLLAVWKTWSRARTKRQRLLTPMVQALLVHKFQVLLAHLGKIVLERLKTLKSSDCESPQADSCSDSASTTAPHSTDAAAQTVYVNVPTADGQTQISVNACTVEEAMTKLAASLPHLPRSSFWLVHKGRSLKDCESLPAVCDFAHPMELIVRSPGGGGELSKMITQPLNEFGETLSNITGAAGGTAQHSSTSHLGAEASEVEEEVPLRAQAVASLEVDSTAHDAALMAQGNSHPEICIQAPATMQERNPDLVEAIVRGHWGDKLEAALLANEVPKTIRVFLSSTFTDTAEERNSILKVVVPKLQARFAEHGYEFQASEMRWSIRANESDDMQTSGICMMELTNCQASAGLNYVFIGCSKYGFRPPPKTIPRALFLKLVAALEEADRRFVEQCYKLDTNIVPTPAKFKSPVPTCGPSRHVRDEWDRVDEATYVLQINTQDWSLFEKLVLILREAACKVWHWESEAALSPKSNHWLKKFIISVTEEEFCHGLLWANPEPDRTRFKLFYRSFAERPGSFKGIPLLDPKAKNFVDMKDAQKGEVDQEAQELLERQKAIRKPDHAWTIPWVPGKGVDPEDEDHKKYLTEFCARFEEYCVKSLNEALAKEIKPDPVADEPERHLRFAAQRARKFHPTPTAMKVLDDAKTFLDTGRKGKAFVLHGKSGAGKTYIMSELTRQAAVQAMASGGVCLVRFLGTTAASSKTALLLESLVLQLAQAYGKDTIGTSIPSDIRELQALFVEAVKTWPSEAKPLTLILDSVDQLDDTNGGRRLEWLPATGLPAFVRVIVSSLPDYAGSNGKAGFKCLSRLRSTIEDEACFSKVEDITDPREVVEHLLLLQGRTITEEQMQAVLGAFNSRGTEDMAGTPLWLTLVAQWSAGWHSYDSPPVIPRSVRALILRLFEDLATKRGPELVFTVLAYITRSKAGISEVELSLLLSLVDMVLAESYEWWAPPVRVVPCICVTRILADLRPYLATRGSGNALGWYHRQFWEAAEAWLFENQGSEVQERVHGELADFFSGKYHGVAKEYTPKLREVVQKYFAGETAGDRLVPAQPAVLCGDVFDPGSTAHVRLNERRLTEYVYHCARAGLQDETLEELSSPRYIALKFLAGMGADLQLELIDVMQRFPHAAAQLQRVRSFVGKHLDTCSRLRLDLPASAVLSAAFNEPDASPVRQSLLTASPEAGKHLIRWLNRPQHFDPCQLVLSDSSSILCVAYASDGTRVAYGCKDATIKVCSLATAEILSTLRGHTGEVNSVAFSPDCQMLASGSDDKTVRLWNPSTGEEKSSLRGHTDWVTSVCFSPDGQMLASGSEDTTVRLWNPSTGEEKRSLRGHTGEVRSVAFSPDGQMLASGSDDQTVRVWNPLTGEETLTGHTNYVFSVAFSPDGKSLASGSWDETVRLWDPWTGEEKSSLTGHTECVRSVAFSPDGQMLASGSDDRTVRVWNPSTGEEKSSLTGHTNRVTRVAFSPDGKSLASGSWDETVRLWDPSTGEEKRSLRGHTGDVNSVAFSPDGQMLASGSHDKTVRLWNPLTGEEKSSLTGHTQIVTSVCFSPDGQMLASGSTDQTVRLWNPSTGEEKSTLSGHTKFVTSVCFSPDGKSLASGSWDETVRLWNPLTGEEKSTLSGHTKFVTSVCFSPDGQMLASGSKDTTVRLWNPSTGEEKSSLRGHTGEVNSVAFSPDCQMLASGSSDKTVRLWNPSTGEEKSSLSGSLFCWCPGHIATAEGKAIRVYQMDGKLVSYLLAPQPVSSIACSGEQISAGCSTGEQVHLRADFLTLEC